MIARLLLSLIAASVLGCSTLSKTECQQMDWREKGRVDALAGKVDSKIEFEKYRKACQLHQEEGDSHSYHLGFSKGRYEYLKDHCSSLASEVMNLDGRLVRARSQQMDAQESYLTLMATVPPDDPSRFSRESRAQSEISSYDSKAGALEVDLNQKRAELMTCESELAKQKEKVQ